MYSDQHCSGLSQNFFILLIPLLLGISPPSYKPPKTPYEAVSAQGL